MNVEAIKHYKDRSVWQRGLYMLGFIFLLGIAKFVAFAVVLFLFLSVLITGEANEKLVKFGQSLSTYQYQILIFLTYNSEEHPFPLGDWPEDKVI
jgi:hypothetical protein